MKLVSDISNLTKLLKIQIPIVYQPYLWLALTVCSLMIILGGYFTSLSSLNQLSSAFHELHEVQRLKKSQELTHQNYANRFYLKEDKSPLFTNIQLLEDERKVLTKLNSLSTFSSFEPIVKLLDQIHPSHNKIVTEEVETLSKDGIIEGYYQFKKPVECSRKDVTKLFHLFNLKDQSSRFIFVQSFKLYKPMQSEGRDALCLKLKWVDRSFQTQ